MSGGQGVFDLWLQASTPPADNGAAMVLGMSSLDRAMDVLGLERDGLEVSPVADGTEWASFTEAGVGLSLGEGRVVQAISFARGAFAQAVEAAALNGASDADVDFTLGSMAIRLGDMRLQWLASLPNFIEAINIAARDSGVVPVWTLSGTEYDKWLRISVDLPLGGISAEFRLGFHKQVYEPGVRIDYFLSALSVHARIASAM